MTRRRLHLVSAFFASVVLAACGITDPYTHHAAHSSTATSAARSGATTGTVTDPSEPAPSTPTTTAASGVTAGTSTFGAATPRQALRLYARLYINWTATTIGAHQRHLAAISQGTARAAALQAAASYRRDPELERSRVANTGAIVSLAAGQGPHRGWSSGEWMLMDWTAHLWNISDRQVVYPYNFDRHHFSRWITACHMRDHRTPAMTDSLGDPQ